MFYQPQVIVLGASGTRRFVANTCPDGDSLWPLEVYHRLTRDE